MLITQGDKPRIIVLVFLHQYFIFLFITYIQDCYENSIVKTTETAAAKSGHCCSSRDEKNVSDHEFRGHLEWNERDEKSSMEFG